MISSIKDAKSALDSAWQQVVSECRLVLGSELHYQAMIYHALRVSGAVPVSQLGMNVKQNIPDVATAFFQSLRDRRHEAYREGFEPIPDVVIFSDAVCADWRRRRCEVTLRSMLLAIEVKASERAGGRLGRAEIAFDIRKLAAHRAEALRLGGGFHPVVVVIDTAPDVRERMTDRSLDEAKSVARAEKVELRYLSPIESFVQQ